MEFLSLSRRRSSARNVPIGEERGETDVFAGYKLPVKYKVGGEANSYGFLVVSFLFSFPMKEARGHVPPQLLMTTLIFK